MSNLGITRRAVHMGGASVTEQLAGKGAIVVFVIATLMVIVAIIVFIVYRIKRSDLRSTVILKVPRKLFDQSTPHKLEASSLPPTINGQEFSYGLWLYLADFHPTADHRLLLMRSANGTLSGATPVVFLDNRTNKLYIVARTNISKSAVTLGELLDKNVTKHLHAVVEYVPLQRWVHIVFVLQDNLMTVYLDGDMYTVENVHDLYNPAMGGDRPVFAGQSGDATVGAINATASTNGFISRVEYFNYALMQRDVKRLYQKGPVKTGMLGKVGIPSYGVRTPVYRVDQ
jgi:hypothetical protein